MHIASPIQRKHARIEIIPLIDIMFFLLASFMMVSLSMTKVENVPVNLPPALQVRAEFGADMLHIAVDRDGRAWVEKRQTSGPELYTILTNRFLQNPQLPVFIGGDTDTTHGDMVRVLELVRQAGIQKIAFTVAEGGASRP